MTRAERLFEILGGLDDELVEEAAQPVPHPRVIPWRRWAALAACLLLAAGVWNLSRLRMGGAAAGGGNSAVPQAEMIANPDGEDKAVTGDAGPKEDRVGKLPEQALDEKAPANGPEAGIEGAAPTEPPQPCPSLYDAARDDAQWLTELNRDLAGQIAAQGVPDSLPIYVDGQAKGPYPLISQEDAWAAQAKHGSSDYSAAFPKLKEAELRYVSHADGVTLPCWRFSLADGGTLDVPAVEVRDLEGVS